MQYEYFLIVYSKKSSCTKTCNEYMPLEWIPLSKFASVRSHLYLAANVYDSFRFEWTMCFVAKNVKNQIG